MSKPAAELSTTLSERKPSEPSVDATDEVAALLAGENESETEDTKDEETQTIESKTDDDEESNEEEAEDGEEEETDLSAIADDEATWETVLGVEDGKLSYDEKGDINGFNVKVDGETSTVNMADLIAGYQTNKSVTQRSQAFADEKKAFEGLKEQTEQLYASKLQSVDALTKHFEKQLIGEYDNINWEELRSKDPAEYAAARQDFSTKAGELQKIQEAINNDMAEFSQESQNKQIYLNQEYRQKQYDLMIDKNPEWSDEKVRNTAKTSYQKFVSEQYGFNDQEFDSVFDARLIELIKDAKSYREGLKVADKKKQKAVPKFQKSRGTSKAKVSKLDKLTTASHKAHGDEKRELQKSAIAELLLGGQ